MVTRWIYFVQAPGLIPGGEAHQIFALYEGYEDRDGVSNRFSYFERTRWEPLGLLIYLLAVRGARKVNLRTEGRPTCEVSEKTRNDTENQPTK